MAATLSASRRRSDNPWCWLLGLTRAALGWVFISVNAMLPFSSWPQMPTATRMLLIAAAVLSAATGFILLFWAAIAVRDRS